MSLPTDKAEFQAQFKYPHCDARVLHGPGCCKFCDMYPERQLEREQNRINCTGQRRPGFELCPSEVARPLEVINRWPGNRIEPLVIVWIPKAAFEKISRTLTLIQERDDNAFENDEAGLSQERRQEIDDAVEALKLAVEEP